MPEFNRELAAKTLAHLVTFPDKHRQETWFTSDVVSLNRGIEPVSVDEDKFSVDALKHDCGTAACLAGWATALAGYRVEKVPAYLHETAGGYRVVSDKGEKLEVSSNISLATEGRQLLGLSKSDADILFLELSDNEAVAVLYLMLELNISSVEDVLRNFDAKSIYSALDREERFRVDFPDSRNVSYHELTEHLFDLATEDYAFSPKEDSSGVEQLLLF